MKTIILSGSANGDISPLTQGFPTGMLQLDEKPLAAISIAGILAAAKSKIYLHSQHPTELLANILRPYLESDVKLLTIPYFIEEQTDEMLWLRDDVLYDLDFSALLSRLRNGDNHSCTIVAGGVPVLFYKKSIPLIFFKRVYDGEFQSVYPEFTAHMGNLDYCRKLLTSYEWQILRLQDGRTHEIDTLEKHHLTSIKLMRGDFEHIGLNNPSAHPMAIEPWYQNMREPNRPNPVYLQGNR